MIVAAMKLARAGGAPNCRRSRTRCEDAAGGVGALPKHDLVPYREAFDPMAIVRILPVTVRIPTIADSDSDRSRTLPPVRVSDAGLARAFDAAQGGGGPASESLRRTNPRAGAETLAVYGDLVARRRGRKMMLRRLVKAGGRR